MLILTPHFTEPLSNEILDGIVAVAGLGVCRIAVQGLVNVLLHGIMDWLVIAFQSQRIARILANKVLYDCLFYSHRIKIAPGMFASYDQQLFRCPGLFII